jgi:hypothetical protein
VTKELEQAQALLEAHGWKVERPPFDDPYEVMYRRMMLAGWLGDPMHPSDDPTNPEYDWGESDKAQLAFLKAHFVLKTEVGNG